MTTMSQLLSDLADHLKLDAVVLNVAKRHQTPEEAEETKKTIARAKELSEQARQKSQSFASKQGE